MTDIPTWATSHGATIAEARTRFAQYVVLCGIASVRSLRTSLVFTGGNALDFVWLPNRSTVDLDFSIDPSSAEISFGVDSIRSHLGPGLTRAGSQFGVEFAIHRVRPLPPGANRTFVTFQANVGYGLPDQPRLLLRMRNGETSPHIIPVEMSVNEIISGSTEVSIDARYPSLRISTIEDIVGEKLRALLQQPIRRRERRQDLLDIAIIVQETPNLDRRQVARALVEKAAGRDILVSRDSFRDPAVAGWASVGYEELASTTRVRFVPFDEALDTVLRFVDELRLS